MTYFALAAQAHRLQARTYRAYALAASIDPHQTEEQRRSTIRHFAELSAEYERLADSYASMEKPQ